jgi:GWxTD domain-containing protein
LYDENAEDVMKMQGKTISRFIFGSILMTGFLAGPLLSEIKPRDLPERYRLWLETEVFYIITPLEKEVFLKLNSDEERELFIKAFWAQRDPSPGSDRNEFRDEHMRRFQYANRRFTAAGKPGWKTDRGKIYILLGEPKSIRNFNSLDIHFPAELWYYQGVEGYGLPHAFHLLFFQRGRIGDFLLYNPASDGPWSLLARPDDYIGDYALALDRLDLVDPELAMAAVSLIPGETVVNFPSLASAMLLQNIDISAQKRVEDRYARKFFDYKDIVEVEYSANYIDSDAQLQIIRDKSGTDFVHFSMEPGNISMGSYQKSVYTTLEFNGRLTDPEGRTVYQFEKRVPLNFTPEQFQKMRQRPFAFTEVFPVVPGEYRLSCLAKNTVSKEFTSFEARIAVTPETEGLTMTPLLLGFNAQKASETAADVKPFLVDGLQLYSQARPTFIRDDRLYVYFQVWSLPQNLAERGRLRYTISQDDVEQLSLVRNLAEAADRLNFLEVFPLEKLTPGYYKIRVSLLEAGGAEIQGQEEAFEISPVDYLPRPWVVAHSQVEGGPDQVDYILGLQRLNKGDPEGAFPILERVRRADPSSLDYAAAMARAQFELGRYADVWATLADFEDKVKADYDLSILLGRAYQAGGKYDEAIRYLDSAVAVFGINTQLLNLLGECYSRLGDRAAALDALEKSLELNPNQDQIKQLVQSLKKE